MTLKGTEERSAQQARAGWPEPVVGAKYVRLLQSQLQQLRDEDAHGNRKLFLDNVLAMYLLAFFNPAVRSLRMIEDLSQTPSARKHLSVPRVCKSTLSDFNQLADPARLEPILNALRSELNRKALRSDDGQRDLLHLLKRTIAVDGTFLPAVADVAWAVANSNNHGTVRHRARLDTHLHVSTWLPELIVVPEPGESEADSACRHLQPGNIYIYDRGFVSFDLIRTHYAAVVGETESLSAQAHFVIRYKPAGVNSPQLQDAVDQPLTTEDCAAGILSDRIGSFQSQSAARAGIPHVRLREILIRYEHQGEPQTLRLITNLLDVSANTIGQLYRHRWQIELFFRWFKSFAHFGQLISHCRAGVLTHLYVTIIGVLLMYLHTGYRPSKYLFGMLSVVASGGATLEDVLPILRERERRCELDRQSAARRKAKKSK